MIGLELVDGSGALLDAERTARVKAALLDAGVIVGSMSHAILGPESLLYVSPPLVLTRSQADRIVSAFRVALQAI